MSDANYITSVVKILEPPKYQFLEKKYFLTKVRVQLSQRREQSIVTIILWGNLGHNIFTYSKVNDYVIVSGYISTRLIDFSGLLNTTATVGKKTKKIVINVRKFYPFFLNPRNE